jgi:hypothetical protein
MAIEIVRYEPSPTDAGQRVRRAVRVAEIEADSLEETWRLSEHDAAPTGNWLENKGVTPLVEATRSNMVGDVFVLDGKPYLVAPIGFRRLDTFPPEVDEQEWLRMSLEDL